MEKNRNEYNSFNLILFIWRWKGLLIGITLLAAVLAFVFSSPWIIKPKYKSTAIIYAPRTNALSQILLNQQNYNERLDVKAYGTELETEQMMQILLSQDMKDAMIDKFNLLVHYDIDSTKKAWKTKLYKTFDNNCVIKRTQYGAISINVMDVDPIVAADMANAIVDELDEIKNRIDRGRAEAAYYLLKKQLTEIDAEIDRLDDSLKVIMEEGVYDFESQSERIMQQYAIAVAQGNKGAENRLQNELQKLSKYGQKAVTIREKLLLFREYEVLCKSKMMDAKADMESLLPVKFVVQKAIVADKKAYPKRLMIIITSAVITFIFSLMILLFVENIKNSISTSPKKKCEEN
ncbi:MAG TPA: Wzz/FepE/Etk N-terminal domain-containing protein [Bacteroidales bacterium]|nr:Wzz/FepE/Etk N-terminal domain-containing protein [Bacteroidales bacterium]